MKKFKIWLLMICFVLSAFCLSAPGLAYEVGEIVEWHCNTCGKTTSCEVLMSVPGTCSKYGTVSFLCQVCNKKIYSSTPKSPDNHTWIVISQTDPTCHASGSVNYSCSGCGVTKVEQLPAVEHVWEETGRMEATTTAPGLITYTCSHCGDTRTEEISILPPDPPDPPGPPALDDVLFVNWLGSVLSLFSMTLDSIIGFPALRLFAGVLVFLMMFSLLAKLLRQGRRGQL